MSAEHGLEANLPAGVSSGDSHFFYDEAERDCTCSHALDVHAEYDGACLDPECDCEFYDPDYDPTDEELDA